MLCEASLIYTKKNYNEECIVIFVLHCEKGRLFTVDTFFPHC